MTQPTSGDGVGLSNDGRYVIFDSAVPYTTADTNEINDTYLYSLATGSYDRVSGRGANGQTSGEIIEDFDGGNYADVSDNGRYALFHDPHELDENGKSGGRLPSRPHRADHPPGRHARAVTHRRHR